MSILYKHVFFSTKEDAETFRKKNKRGVIYSNVKGSRTRHQYTVERDMACMEGLSIDPETLSYVVAWNEVV